MKDNHDPENFEEWDEQTVRETHDRGKNGGSHGLVGLLLAVAVFIGAVVTSLLLINYSTENQTVSQPKTDTAQIKYNYKVNVQPPVELDTDAPELQPPVSKNDSNIFNIVLIGLDETTDKTDTVMLLSINTVERRASLLSIPKDTYVSGNYELPKLNEIYRESKDSKRGLEAIVESVRGMFGFRPDYYYLLDESALTAALELTGGLSFTVPSEPDYSALSAGTKTLQGGDAIKLLCYRDDFEEIETDSAQVQRQFILVILDALVSRQETILEDAQKLAAASTTDMTANELAYFGYLLKDASFTSSFSRVLPGETVKIGDTSFYQVDTKEALDMINDNFNPLPRALTTYNLNFRQKTGSSTEGNYSPFGFPTKRTTTEEETEEST